jgi:hypothetical protein
MAQTTLVREMFEGLGTLDGANLGGCFTSFVNGSFTKAAVGPRLSSTSAPGWSAALPFATEVRARIDLTAGTGLPAKNSGVVGAWFRFSSNVGGFDAVNNCRLLGLNWAVSSYVKVLTVFKNFTITTTGINPNLSAYQLQPDTWYYFALSWLYVPTTYTTKLWYKTIEMPALELLHTSGPAASGGTPLAVSVEDSQAGGVARFCGRLGGVGLYSIADFPDVTYDMGILPPVEQSNPWYLNTGSGNDANTGITAGTAWQTAAKLNSAQANGVILAHADDGIPGSGDKIYLDTQSTPLDLSSQLSFIIQSLSIQAAPGNQWITIKPYKVLAPGSWTLTGNGVYQTTDTLALCTVWEDDKWLNHPNGSTYAAVQASMEATPGSFWTDGTTLYLHPFGNTDPRSDGKTYTRSNVGVTTPAVAMAARNLYARDFSITKTCDTNMTTSAPNAGYCWGDAVGIGGKCLFEHIFLSYGGKHDQGFTSDADNSDITFQDMQCEQCAIFGGAGAATPWVSYMAGTAKVGNIHRYIRCTTSKNRGVVGSSAGVADLNSSWAYSHNNGTGTQFSELQYIDCQFPGGSIGSGTNGVHMAKLTIIGCRVGLITASSSALNIWSRNTFDLRTTNSTIATSTYLVRNNIFAPTANFLNGQFLGCEIAGTWTIEGNTFDLRGIASSDNANRGILKRVNPLNLTFRNNVVLVPAGKQDTVFSDGVNTDTLTFSNNGYLLGAGLLVANNYNDGATTANRTFSQWQGLGKDANSLTSSDLKLGPDLQPTEDSPVVGAGVNLGPLEDFSGTIFTVRDDLGAYEFVSPPAYPCGLGINAMLWSASNELGGVLSGSYSQQTYLRDIAGNLQSLSGNNAPLPLTGEYNLVFHIATSTARLAGSLLPLHGDHLYTLWSKTVENLSSYTGNPQGLTPPRGLSNHDLIYQFLLLTSLI